MIKTGVLWFPHGHVVNKVLDDGSQVIGYLQVQDQSGTVTFVAGSPFTPEPYPEAKT